MAEPSSNVDQRATGVKLDRASDHLANERTFLAWVRTGVAFVVFGFAIGRFAIAIRQFFKLEGRPPATTGVTVWFGTTAIIAGVVLTLAGLLRYRRTRAQLESGNFEPAGYIIDLVAILVGLAGVALAVYLVYIEVSL